MSRNDLHRIANETSPDEVRVPNTISGLVFWATAKFGAGILMAIVLGVSTVRVYEDLTALNNRVLIAFENQTRAAEANNSATREMIEIIKNVERSHAN